MDNDGRGGKHSTTVALFRLMVQQTIQHICDTTGAIMIQFIILTQILNMHKVSAWMGATFTDSGRQGKHVTVSKTSWNGIQIGR